MAITREKALKIAHDYLEKDESDGEIDPDKGIERLYGWFFEIRYRKPVAPGGLMGLFVFKDKEIIIPLGSWLDFEEWIDNFDKRYGT